jgi:hypothetical protein
MNKKILSFLWVPFLSMLALSPLAFAADDDAHAERPHSAQSHSGHSDALIILLGHKIALQKLQDQKPSGSTLTAQAKHIKQAMPVLQSYMSTPKTYYPTTTMYHSSLENRAAMLADFSTLLMEYQKQLVSPP